jgi:hypothetical protein
MSPFLQKFEQPRGHFKCNFHLPSTNFVVSRLRTQQYHGYAISSIRLAISKMVSWGNLPATSFTQDLPPGLPADCLLLGCGDPRNILFTICYEEDNGISIDFTADIYQVFQGNWT